MSIIYADYLRKRSELDQRYAHSHLDYDYYYKLSNIVLDCFSDAMQLEGKLEPDIKTIILDSKDILMRCRNLSLGYTERKESESVKAKINAAISQLNKRKWQKENNQVSNFINQDDDPNNLILPNDQPIYKNIYADYIEKRSELDKRYAKSQLDYNYYYRLSNIILECLSDALTLDGKLEPDIKKIILDSKDILTRCRNLSFGFTKKKESELITDKINSIISKLNNRFFNEENSNSVSEENKSFDDCKALNINSDYETSSSFIEASEIPSEITVKKEIKTSEPVVNDDIDEWSDLSFTEC